MFRDRVGMFTSTHHYAVLSALVQGQLSGVTEVELFGSFGRWVSGDLGCVHNNVGWPWQIASHVAPSWKDRPREPGVGFMDLAHDESDAASVLLIDLLLRFCDFTEAWAAATGVASAPSSEPAAGNTTW